MSLLFLVINLSIIKDVCLRPDIEQVFFYTIIDFIIRNSIYVSTLLYSSISFLIKMIIIYI